MLQVERPRVIVPPVKDAIERIVSLPEGEQDGLVSQLLLDGFYPTCIVSSGWLASAIVCSFV